MALPASVGDLKALGYMYDSEGTCRGCGERIEWWITPKGKRMPISVQKPDPLHSSEEIRVSHFSNCPNADDFRKK